MRATTPRWTRLLVLGTAGAAACVASPPRSAREAAEVAYERGWSQVLDAGRWSAAEESYRAAMGADPDWVLGRVLVGRITSDVDEREALLAWVEQRRDAAPADERLLIDVFAMNLRAANARDRGEELEPAFFALREERALANLRAYLERHPEDAYVSAELVEWIHAVEGARAALFAIESEVSPQAAEVPFFTLYRAQLLSELGHHARAIALADEYAEQLDDPGAPGPPALRARIWLAMGRPDRALVEADAALALDGANLAARATRARARERLGTSGGGE